MLSCAGVVIHVTESSTSCQKSSMVKRGVKTKDHWSFPRHSSPSKTAPVSINHQILLSVKHAAMACLFHENIKIRTLDDSLYNEPSFTCNTDVACLCADVEDLKEKLDVIPWAELNDEFSQYLDMTPEQMKTYIESLPPEAFSKRKPVSTKSTPLRNAVITLSGADRSLDTH